MIDNKLFWSNGKRCPTPLNLDDSYDFINITTKLLCNCYNINNEYCLKDLILYIQNYKKDLKFIPKDVTIPKDDSEIKEEILIETKLLFTDNNIPNLYPQYFEKDDDSNYHVAWLTVASNCRSKNYGIPLTDEYTTKGIAGKIIPAVATTTSTIVGLICMELYKYLLNGKESNYLSYFLNMANNTFVGAEPIKAPKIKIGNLEFNSWEKLQYKTNSTLQEFINHYEDKFNTKITMILYNSIILYSFFMPNNLNVDLKSIVEKKTNTIINDKINIIIACEDDFDIPNIELSFK
jgi:ubiquitin-activating enzyme E1